jgi:CubicO group peptidase (beta-lactamase class C family)
MTSTGSDPEDQQEPPRAVGYTSAGTPGRVRPNSDTLPYRGTAAGGGYTTVGDLLRFATALLDHRLLDVEHTRLATTGRIDAAGGRYAYGLIDALDGDVRSWGHGGGAPGMNGDLRIFPDTGYVVAVLANMDPPAAEQISTFVSRRLPAR